MKMRLLFFILLFIFPFFAYGEIKNITKKETVIVPSYQSEEQVLKYTSDKLFRQAAEEAGVAISTNTTLVDGKISKDEIKMQTSAIAKKETKLLEKETKNGQTYITVEVTATVDSDELDAFLRQLMQNEELKQQLAAERKKNLELEKKIAKASKEEYSKLSKEAEELAKERQARQKQLEIDIANARRLLLEAERKQKAEELKAAQDLERIKRETAARDTALKAKIAAEKDAQAKAEMEYQALLAEITQNAILNDKYMDTKFNNTVEEIAIDAGQVRVNFAGIINEYNTITNANLKQMEAYHKSQLQVLEAQAFNEEEPVKGDWDDNATYNEKLSDYEKRKIDFQNRKSQDIANLEAEYQNKVNENIKTSKQSLLNALKPLYERLKKYNKGENIGDYISSDTSRAVISFGERDLDKLTLPITIKYKNKTYNFIYKFDSLEEFRLMYETRASFKAEPIYALTPNGDRGAKPYLRGFLVIHLGNNKEKFFPINGKYKIFPEIILYESMLKELSADSIPYVSDNVSLSQNTQSDVVVTKKSYKSDMQKNRYNNYRLNYGGFGVALAGASDDDESIFNVEVAAQYHWRFNRWIGMYINGSILVGMGKEDYEYEEYYDFDDEYGLTPRYTSGTQNKTDVGIVGGVGLDFYITNNILLFGEANIGAFIDTDEKDKDDNGFGGIIKGGVAFQSSFMEKSGFRLNIFVEQIFAETISGDKTLFGAGIYWFF